MNCPQPQIDCVVKNTYRRYSPKNYACLSARIGTTYLYDPKAQNKLPKQTEFGLSNHQPRTHSRTNKIELPQTNIVWVKATINRGHTHGPLKLLTFVIHQDKKQLPHQ